MTIKGKLTCMAITVLVLLLLTTGVIHFKAVDMLSDTLNREALSDTISSGKIIKGRLDTAISLMSQAGVAVGFGIEDRSLGKPNVERLLRFFLDSSPQNSNNWISELFFGWESDGWFSSSTRHVLPNDFDSRSKQWYIEAVKRPSSVVLSEQHINWLTKKTRYNGVSCHF